MRPTPKLFVALSSLLLIISAAMPLAAPARQAPEAKAIFAMAEGIAAPATIKAAAPPRLGSMTPAAVMGDDQTGR
jgi:hypothetical protein